MQYYSILLAKYNTLKKLFNILEVMKIEKQFAAKIDI